MIKRTIYFGNPAKLTLALDQLAIYLTEKDEKRTIPIEDIGIIVLDNSQISITHGAMNALLDNNAAILFCDSKHLPNGLVLPMTANHTFTEKLKAQLEASEPLKKQLWKQTIQAKILNQAAVLEIQKLPVDNMKYWSKSVGSGDPENYEGRAAAYYWKKVFEDNPTFLRHRYGDFPNNLLNYGYAVLRAIVARSLVGSGCLPALGIHHRNKYNAFCLADDIMEPYRPYVDLLVLKTMPLVADDDTELTPFIKQQLLQIPVIDVTIDGMQSPLMVAMQRTTASLMKCFEGESRKIVYPVL